MPSYHGTPKVKEGEIVAADDEYPIVQPCTWAVEAVNPLGQPTNLESLRTSDSLQASGANIHYIQATFKVMHDTRRIRT
jgi:hypothetical protein